MRSAVLLLLLAGCGSAEAGRRSVEGPDIRRERCADRRGRNCQPKKKTPTGPLFKADFPADFSAIKADICAAHADDLSAGGNWFCMRGDGTWASSSASFGLTFVGTPASLSPPVTCPNGTTCAAAPHMYFSGTGQYAKTGAVSTPAGDFSVYMVLDTESTAANKNAFAKMGATNSFQIATQAYNSGPYVQLYGSATDTIYLGAGCNLHGPLGLAVTFKRAGDGTSTLKTYCRGVLDTTRTNIHLPNASTIPWSVMAASTGSGATAGLVRAVLFSEVEWTATQIAAIDRSARGAIVPKAGAAPFFARGEKQTCPAADETAFSALAYNNPCINSSGLLAPLAQQPAEVSSEELNAAAWTAGSTGAATAPVVTADSAEVPSPKQYTTQDKVVFPAVGAGDSSYLSQTFTATAGGYSTSLFGRTLSGAGTLHVWFHDNTANTDTTPQACAFIGGWLRCRLSPVTLTAGSWAVRLGLNGTAGATAVQTLYLLGVQVEKGSVSNYTRTAASSNFGVQVAAGTLTNPLSLADATSFSASVCLTPPKAWGSWTGADVDLMLIGTKLAANSFRLFVANTTGAVGAEVYDATGASGSNKRYWLSSTTPTFVAGVPVCVQAVRAGREVFLLVDGKPQHLTAASTDPVGQGTGIFGAMPTTLAVLPSFGGYYTSVCLDRTPTGCVPSLTRVALLGDSILAGPASAARIEDVMRGTSSTMVYNFSLGGKTTAQVLSGQWTPEAVGAGFSKAFVLTGINDAAADMTRAAITADITSLVAAIEADGAGVVLARHTPFKGSGGWTTARQAVLDGVWTDELALCAASPSKRTCLDATDTLKNPADVQALLPAYDSGDHVHLTTAGETALGNVLKTAMP
jgi:hypothetical protein